MGGGKRGRCTWVRRSAAASWTARHGVLGCAYLEAAQGDDLLLRPNPEGEGMGSLAEDVLGAVIVRVEWGDDASTPEPDEEGAGEIS